MGAILSAAMLLRHSLHLEAEARMIEAAVEQAQAAVEQTQAAAERLVNAVLKGIEVGLQKDKNVQLVGFGTFAVSKRAGRTGRNPRTGAAIKIKPAKVPKFKPGKALKDAIR